MFRVGRHRCGDCVMSDWNEFDPERRKKIRDKLEVYAKRLGRKAIARAIEKDSETVVHPDTIKRFLKQPLTARDGTVALFESFVRKRESHEEALLRQNSAPAEADELRLFPALQSFFQMGSGKVAQFLDKIVGTWGFFAYSESGKDYVCRGALRLETLENGDFWAEELQESIVGEGEDASTIQEHYSGHFFFRKDSMVVLLKERVHAVPKVYIFSIEPYFDKARNYAILDGSLLKIRSKGGDTFFTNVHMIRSAKAFENCDVLPRSKVPPSVFRHLDRGH